MGSERAIVVNKKLRGGGANSQILAFALMDKTNIGGLKIWTKLIFWRCALSEVA